MMQSFISYLENKNLSKTTQRAYQHSINLFLSWYKEDVINCAKKDILKYLKHLQQKEQSNRTRSCALTPLHHYFSFLVKSEIIASNPAALIKIRGTHKKTLYNIYTPEQLIILHDNYYHSFIRNFDDSHIPQSTRHRSLLSQQRNYIMLGFFIYQGLVSNELHKIKMSDIDLNKATVKIAGGRKSNERTIALHALQIGSLIHYINNIRPQFLQHCKGNTDALFLPLPEHNQSSRNAMRLSGSLQYLAEQIKTVDKNFLNLKQIRASVITQWLKTEGLRKTQYLAGHRYISSTEYYLPNNLEGLIDDITKYNPFLKTCIDPAGI